MATTKTITNKDVLVFIKAVLDSGVAQELVQATPFLASDFSEKTDKMLATLEKKSKKSADGSSEKAKENLAFAQAIAEIMPDNTTFAVSEICSRLLSAGTDGKFIMPDGETEVTRSKISTVMGVGSENGLFTAVSEYKVGGKGRAVKGYVKVTD